MARAWERFASGDDTVPGVRPNILLSWYRCRDLYHVDPARTAAPLGHGGGQHNLRQEMIFTQLGGAAGAAAAHVEMDRTLVTVTDPEGRILASWGPSSCLRRGVASTLAPRFDWSETASGTNGMGTALERPGIAQVDGAEHWCAGFHEWRCAGIAVRDPVTQLPLAALNVSRWGEELPEEVAHWLRRTAADVESELRHQAIEHGGRLVEAFTAHETAGATVLVLDEAGKVVQANEAARQLLGVVCPVPSVEPHARLAPDLPELAQVLERAIRRGNDEPDWHGFVDIVAPGGEQPLTVQLFPVRFRDEVIGVLVTDAVHPSGEYLNGPDVPGGTPRFPPRIPALRGSRVVLLCPQEIRYAEADNHAVWLVTDQGRLRAATRGLDNVEGLLNPAMFLRVHRRFIVNLGRVRELEYGFKGALTVNTSTRDNEAIPVSRRHVNKVRHALGLSG